MKRGMLLLSTTIALLIYIILRQRDEIASLREDAAENYALGKRMAEINAHDAQHGTVDPGLPLEAYDD